ncbi:MAG TPA: hypothetical protein PK156_35410 [Polyangium sp.]|nr:hypothetical protein [Polyangium sp.]
MVAKKSPSKKKTPAARAAKPQPKLPAFVIPTEEEILGANPRAVTLIAASDRLTWQVLVPIMRGSDVCPEKLTLALLGIDDFDGWSRRIFHAFGGLNPDDGMEADWVFRRWFTAGVARHVSRRDLRGLHFRMASAMRDVDDGATKRIRELSGEIEMSIHEGNDASDDKNVRTDLLGRAVLLLAIRVGEDGDREEQLVQTQRAEDIFAAMGASEWVGQTRRIRAGALLCSRRIDEALAVLATIWDTPRPDFMTHCSLRSGSWSDPTSDLLKKAAHAASWASRIDPQWLDAVKTMAEKLAHPGCALWLEETRKMMERLRPIDVTSNNTDEPSIWDLFEAQGRIV